MLHGEPQVRPAPVIGGGAQEELGQSAPAHRKVAQRAEQAQDRVGLLVLEGAQRQIRRVAQHQGAGRALLFRSPSRRIVVGLPFPVEPPEGRLGIGNPKLRGDVLRHGGVRRPHQEPARLACRGELETEPTDV